MPGLPKLLVLILAIGLALRFGLPDPLADMLHNLAREAGIPAEMAGPQASWDGSARMLLILTGISLVCALILWLYRSVQRLRDWLRDMFV